MARPKAEHCPCCGYPAVRPIARAGRAVRYRKHRTDLARRSALARLPSLQI